jgi:hypothetical protein
VILRQDGIFENTVEVGGAKLKVGVTKDRVKRPKKVCPCNYKITNTSRSGAGGANDTGIPA